MGQFSYLLESSNHITAEAVIVSADVDPLFPESNLASLPISKPSILLGLTAQKILIALPVASAVTAFAIINHNLTSVATITLRAGSSSDPSGASFQQTIPWARRDAFAVFSSQTWRYWSIEISDPANRDGFIRIGLLRAGVLTLSGLNFMFGWRRTRRFEAVRPRTEFGTPVIYPLFESTEHQWAFDPLTRAQELVLSNLLVDLQGDGTPLFVLPDWQGTEGYFGRFISNDEVIRGVYARMEVLFLEDGPGRVAVRSDPFLYVAGITDMTNLDAVFARASTATWADSSLELQSAAVDVARVGHHPDRSTRTLLLENSRTNEWTRSEEFDDAVWTKVNATVSANASISPDGLFTADKIVEDSTAAAVHCVDRDLVGTTDDADQTASVFAAAGERTWLYIETTDKSNTVRRSWVNLSTGVAGTVGAGHTVRVRAMANAFTRIEVTFDVASGGTTPKVRFAMATADANVTYSGNGASGIYLWGAQFEKDGPFASSYVPTTSAAVLRSADSLYFPFIETPNAMTVYARFVERGTIQIANAGLLYIGLAVEAGAFLKIFSDGTNYKATLDNGLGATSTSTAAIAPAIGDAVELRVTVSAAGVVQLNQSINSAAEVAAAAGGAIDLPVAFGDDRLYLNNAGQTGSPAVSNTGFTAIASVKILRGAQTLAVMRTAG